MRALEICADCERVFRAGPNQFLCPECLKRRASEAGKKSAETSKRKRKDGEDVRENVIRTQGDKLRAMSDEELAEWLEEHCFQYGGLDWLKSPAEVMHNANPD